MPSLPSSPRSSAAPGGIPGDRPRITVCGLGPGRPSCVTADTLAAISAAEPGFRYLRTGRHPTADLVPGAATFDHLYDAADRFDEVYRAIVEALVAAAEAAHGSNGGPVLYAVPGSPLVLESTVRRLRADPRVAVELLPAVSFLDEAWARLGVDPVDDGVRLVDGHRFGVEAAGERGPLLVAHVHAPWVLTDIKLALDAGPEQRAVVLQRLGTGEERVFEVAWPDLDRVVEPDHLTSLYLPEVAAPVARELARTVELMHQLRRGCPWDRAQTHGSLRPYLLEEAYEVLEALDLLDADGAAGAGAAGAQGGPGEAGVVAVELSGDDGYDLLEEELGDLWFQVLFHAELAAEAGRFTVADVARTLYDKLVSRHPHVFGDADATDPEGVVANWERAKREEKQRASALDGIPSALPALSLAAKVLQRAERAGRPADLTQAVARLADIASPAAAAPGEPGVEPGEPVEEALGLALLGLVGRAQQQGLDAEAALRSAVARAAARFRATEADSDPGPHWVLG